LKALNMPTIVLYLQLTIYSFTQRTSFTRTGLCDLHLFGVKFHIAIEIPKHNGTFSINQHKHKTS